MPNKTIEEKIEEFNKNAKWVNNEKVNWEGIREFFISSLKEVYEAGYKEGKRNGKMELAQCFPDYNDDIHQ